MALQLGDDGGRLCFEEAEPLEAPQIGLEPDIRTPEWLVNMVRNQARADGSDFDPTAIARMAGVPLSSVRRAAELADLGE